MKNRLLSLCLVFVLVFSLAACKGEINADITDVSSLESLIDDVVSEVQNETQNSAPENESIQNDSLSSADESVQQLSSQSEAEPVTPSSAESTATVSTQTSPPAESSEVSVTVDPLAKPGEYFYTVDTGSSNSSVSGTPPYRFNSYTVEEFVDKVNNEEPGSDVYLNAFVDVAKAKGKILVPVVKNKNYRLYNVQVSYGGSLSVEFTFEEVIPENDKENWRNYKTFTVYTYYLTEYAEGKDITEITEIHEGFTVGKRNNIIYKAASKYGTNEWPQISFVKNNYGVTISFGRTFKGTEVNPEYMDYLTFEEVTLNIKN